MSIVLCDLFSVTLYPPRISLCVIKKKKKKKNSYVDFSIFHSLSLARMVHRINSWYQSKTQIGHINATAF